MTEAEWLASDDPRAMLAFARHDDAYGSPIGFRVTDRKLRLFACECARQVWELLTDDAPCPNCNGENIWEDPLQQMKNCRDCSGTGRINRSRRAVEVAERFADGEATAGELESVNEESLLLTIRHDSIGRAEYELAWNAARLSSPLLARNATYFNIVPPATQAALLREIFGNPWRPVRMVPCKWCGREDCLGCLPWTDNPDVLAVANSIYQERRFDWMGQLGDALMDAGCPEHHPLVLHCQGWEPCPDCLNESEYRVYCDTCKGSGRCGWIPLRGPHCLGCWVLSLMLGKE